MTPAQARSDVRDAIIARLYNHGEVLLVVEAKHNTKIVALAPNQDSRGLDRLKTRVVRPVRYNDRREPVAIQGKDGKFVEVSPR